MSIFLIIFLIFFGFKQVKKQGYNLIVALTIYVKIDIGLEICWKVLNLKFEKNFC